MKHYFLTISIFTIVGFISCQTKTELSNSDDKSITQLTKEVNTPFLDSIWNKIIHQNGCLTGGQYHKDGKFGNEGNIMDRSEKWKKFYQLPKDSLTYFLLSKFDITDSTSIHTCPFFNATEGELAVYALQRIHGKNWYEFEEFKQFEIRNNNPPEPPIGNDHNFQNWLNKEILQVPSERKKLQDYFLNEL